MLRSGHEGDAWRNPEQEGEGRWERDECIMSEVNKIFLPGSWSRRRAKKAEGKGEVTLAGNGSQGEMCHAFVGMQLPERNS